MRLPVQAPFQAFFWYKIYSPRLAGLYASQRIHDQVQLLVHFLKIADLGTH